MFPPVPPAITLYAMHRLVSTYPKEKLTPKAKGLRDVYLELAEEKLSAPKGRLITGLGADYSETDPRLPRMDPRGIVLADQPKMQPVEYPVRFKDGTRMSSHESEVSEDAKLLFQHL